MHALPVPRACGSCRFLVLSKLSVFGQLLLVASSLLFSRILLLWTGVRLGKSRGWAVGGRWGEGSGGGVLPDLPVNDIFYGWLLVMIKLKSGTFVNSTMLDSLNKGHG